MKRLLMLAIAVAIAAGLPTAAFSLSWQTQPILGTGYSDITGDAVMITGPTPTTPGGDYYYDVDGNIVLGPTIPHYSIPGDPLFGIGSPSMTEFAINPTIWDGAHWYDPNVWVWTGSGVNLDAGEVTYSGVFTFNPGGANTYDVLAAGATTDFGTNFIMLHSGVGNFWLEDAGLWRYTESWTQGGNTISTTRDFTVKAVPEPMSVMLGVLGLSSVAGFRRLRRK